MNKIKDNLNLIIGTFTFLFIAFFVYNTFFKPEAETDIKEIQIGEVNENVRKIIDILNDIQKITFDTKFFLESHNPEAYRLTFTELRDFSKPIQNKLPGKSNPFLKGHAADYRKSDEINNSDDQEITQIDAKVQETLVDENNNQTETIETAAPVEATETQ